MFFYDKVNSDVYYLSICVPQGSTGSSPNYLIYQYYVKAFENIYNNG